MFVISSYKPFLFEGIKTCSRQHVVVPNATLHWKCILLFKEHDLLISDTRLILGAFHLVKISGISGSVVNGTRFVSSSHWKIPRKSGKSKKVGPFSRLEFPNGMSCSIHVSRSLYQFQVHRRAPRRTGIYDQMEQLFTNRKFHFCSQRNFRVFFPKWKAPTDTFYYPLNVRIKGVSLY